MCKLGNTVEKQKNCGTKNEKFIIKNKTGLNIKKLYRKNTLIDKTLNKPSQIKLFKLLAFQNQNLIQDLIRFQMTRITKRKLLMHLAEISIINKLAK